MNYSQSVLYLLSKFPGPKLWAATHLTNPTTYSKPSESTMLPHSTTNTALSFGLPLSSFLTSTKMLGRSIYAAKNEGGELKKYLPPIPDGSYGIFATPSDE